MDWKLVQCWMVVALCVLYTGCTVCENAHRTMCEEPAEFYWKKDKRRSMALYSQWADAAWQDELQGSPDLAGRADYGMGFRDGFVDFVWGGGTGEPPPVPPRKLWNVAFRSDVGHRMTMDWYDGYRHGARVARDGGYRSMATIRSSLFGLPRDTMSNYPVEMSPQGALDMNGSGHHFETLPTPESRSNSAPALNDTDQRASDSAEKDTIRQRPDDDAPARKPQLPPVPRNLPPTVPRAEEPELDQTPLEQDTPAPEIDSAAPTDRTPGESDEPSPLSIPTPAPEMLPPISEPANHIPAPAPTATSVRFVDVPTIAGGPPRSLPVAPPPSVRSAAARQESSEQFSPPPTAIRLAVATSPVQSPATATPSTSTITIQQGWNALRSPVSSPRESREFAAEH